MSTVFSKSNLAKYTLEATLIVFSVLLALFLDQVLTERRELQAVDELVEYITEEISGNIKVVNKWLPYHESVIAKIDMHLTSTELQMNLISDAGIDYFVLMEDGVLQDFYSVSAWQLALQSEIITKLDIGTTQKISNGYYSQKHVDSTLQRLIDFTFSREAMDKAQLVHSLTLLRRLMQELVGQEYTLRRNYEKALSTLNKIQ
jgi:hypothetical protein